MLLALTKESSVIRLESRHLNIAFTDDEQMQTIPLPLIDRVVLTDTPRISGAVIQELLSRKIPVTFISGRGEFLGQLHFTPGGECERRRLQYTVPEELKLLSACKLLEAKLYNQKRLLQRVSAHRKISCKESREISKLYKRLHFPTNAETLRGIEGLAAKYYFEAFKNFVPAWCCFSERSRHPALDPVNALLSYSYTVMTGEMENLIRLHALDPGAGFLHCDQYNSSTLAFDLMEPFRPGFCDFLVLDLLNHRRLSEKHFERSAGSCRLTPAGRKIFFAAWENKRERKFKYAGNVVRWQDIWNDQVMQWINFLQNSELPSFFRIP